jgi:cytochrome P450 family 628
MLLNRSYLSDTTAVTLTNIFYNLAARPEITKQLQEEIDAACDDGNSEITYDKILSIKLLNAVINESLRMFPAVPSDLERFTPPEGLEIARVYEPGDITINVPMWTIHRCSYGCISSKYSMAKDANKSSQFCGSRFFQA